MTRTELKKDLDVNTSIYGYLIYERKKKHWNVIQLEEESFFRRLWWFNWNFGPYYTTRTSINFTLIAYLNVEGKTKKKFLNLTCTILINFE